MIERPAGPAPVTKTPWSLLTYMNRMQRGGAALVGERFERYGDLYYAPSSAETFTSFGTRSTFTRSSYVTLHPSESPRPA